MGRGKGGVVGIVVDVVGGGLSVASADGGGR